MNRLLSRKSLVLLAVIVLGIINAFSGLLTERLGDDIERLLKEAGIDEYRLHIAAGLIIAGLLATVWIFKAERAESKDAVPRGSVPETKKALREFLADLAGRYQERYRHKLDKRYEVSLWVSDDVEGTHSEQSDEEIGSDSDLSSASRYVIKRFEARGRLVIVGSPGSGKTGLLLNLAKYLAEKAQKDAGQPLPVIFNLASWSQDYASFSDWVMAMLTKGYGLSSDFARYLRDEQLIVYLLDGLDELASNEKAADAARVRAKCVASIYQFLHDGPMSAVICSRRDEFDEMIWRTGMEPSVPVLTVHDLNPLRIDHALNRARDTKRDRFAAPHLQAMLSRDNLYYQVLSTPFYFTTALQVFDSTERPLIDAPDEETLKSNLLVGFIEKKLRVTPNPHRFSHARTLDWLAWLADFMKERVTVELSDLQPSNLRRTWLYRYLFSLFCGVLGGVIMGFYEESLILGVILGVFFSLISVSILTEDFGLWAFEPLRRGRTWLLLLLLGAATSVFAVLSFLIVGIKAGGLMRVLNMSVEQFLAMTMLSLVMGPVAFVAGVGIRLFMRVAVGLMGGIPLRRIVTEDFGRWSLRALLSLRTWRNVLALGVESGWTGLFVITTMCLIAMPGFVAYVLYFTVKGAMPAPTLVEVLTGVCMVPIVIIMVEFVGFLFGFVIGIFVGIPELCRKTARFVNIHSPYQRLRAGIIFNVLQLVLVGWGLFLLDRVSTLPSYWRGTGEFNFSFFPPTFWLFLIFGLVGLFRAPLLKHLTLRVCLTLEGVVPLQYARFLNYATALGILESDRGQWRLRHQILQEHFARCYQDKSSGLASTKAALTCAQVSNRSA